MPLLKRVLQFNLNLNLEVNRLLHFCGNILVQLQKKVTSVWVCHGIPWKEAYLPTNLFFNARKSCFAYRFCWNLSLNAIQMSRDWDRDNHIQYKHYPSQLGTTAWLKCYQELNWPKNDETLYINFNRCFPGPTDEESIHLLLRMQMFLVAPCCQCSRYGGYDT
jgi:hypothetical protein